MYTQFEFVEVLLFLFFFRHFLFKLLFHVFLTLSIFILCANIRLVFYSFSFFFLVQRSVRNAKRITGLAESTEKSLKLKKKVFHYFSLAVYSILFILFFLTVRPTPLLLYIFLFNSFNVQYDFVAFPLFLVPFSVQFCLYSVFTVFFLFPCVA